MKSFICTIFLLFIISFCYAQQVYQIKADSVRIYNTCDTAELILENRTQQVPGFLFNKGRGRTEFQQLKLIASGNNSIAIQGQDTLNIGNIISTWGDERYDLLSTNFVTIPWNASLSWEHWPRNKVVGYDAYMASGMPVLSAQAFQGEGDTTYYNGLVVLDNDSGFEFTVNWDGELEGPNGAFIRSKDDTRYQWSKWRELLFKDYADRSYILNQKITAQSADLWIKGTARIGDSVLLTKYRNNAAGDSVLTTDAAGNLKLKFLTGNGNGGDIYTTDGTLTTNRTLNAGQRSLFFKGINEKTDSTYMLFNYAGVKFGTLNDPFVGGGLSELSTDKYNGVRVSWSKSDTVVYILANKYGASTDYNWSSYTFSNHVDYGGSSLLYMKGMEDVNGGKELLSFKLDSSAILFIKEDTDHMIADTLFRMDKYGVTKFKGEFEATSIYQSSQRILKKDIQPFDRSALNLLNKAAVQTFRYKADKKGLLHIGFIAEDAPEEMVAPERIGIDQANTTALLVKAMQEMSQKMEALQSEIGTLKKELNELKQHAN
ncbi:tail fiber domain-containing protein [Chitinophaga sp. 30R24]|uniref:tail fiber domain-containing protein n=1 Tax=Chitinophaga sp. 30R24 TaxID=3248838 RepID=UPI003B91B234